MKKFIACFIKWNGEKVEEEIREEWIDVIVLAIETQWTIVNKHKKIAIKGSDYSHVDIIEREV